MFFRLVLLLLIALPLPCRADDDPGSFVSSLWLLHRYGKADAVSPGNDQSVKAKLAKALGKEGVLTATGLHGLMEPSAFEKLAGPDGKLSAEEVRTALRADEPASRQRLIAKVKDHADLLTTSFDMIDESHRASGTLLVDWLAKNYQKSQPLHVTVVCTGNSRRSILGATMGNIAASYYGMPEIRFHSGGTAPTAFNPRTITALTEIGVDVEPTGNEAPRGEPKTANPTYHVRWGQSNAPGFETIEFSKTYFDVANPQSGFAALLVCSEADAACPLVKGASVRISMPYLDPKIYDGSPIEATKYAERRDDIGRLMLNVMMQVRNRLAQR
jgi:arsenate reductase (thioredoxin)